MSDVDLTTIVGASYAGKPKDNTMMYITKKVEQLIKKLYGHVGCLVFVEDTILVPEGILTENTIIKSKNPQLEYAKCATEFWRKSLNDEREKGYTLTKDGYYIGEDVSIGNNAYIEPGVVIGHNVKIGDNAIIMAGSVIKNATIGSDLICNENAVIGANGFTIAEDENGDKIRIPSLGSVKIGDNVEVGAHDNISCGSAEDTVIDNNVKLDALVHIGHDVHLMNNVEITAGGIIGGFVTAGEKVYIGINAVVRNRIQIGEGSVIGMGATVTKMIDSGVTVVGNPAKLYKKKE